jgi:outer membrane protein assembly factor BamB
LAALCPAGYVGNASADECDNSPLANIPFRIGIPYTEAFTEDLNTDGNGPDRTRWGLLALNTDGSGVRWFVPLFVGANARGYFGTPTISDGAVYVSTYSHLFSLDTATGAEQWEIRTDDGGFSAAGKWTSTSS